MPEPRSDHYKVAITHTRYSYTGGIEKYIHSLVERLLVAGHEVHYLATRWEPREHPRLFFHRVPFRRFPKRQRVLSFNRGCNRILASQPFDLVHGFTKTDQQDIYTDGSGCLDEYLEATLHDRPAWWRWLYRRTPHQRAIAEMERRRFRRGAIRRIVPMAQFVKDQILAHYPVEPERVEVIYNGVELEHFHPRHRATMGSMFRRRHFIEPDRPVLLFVGNDWARKGLTTLLEALPAIHRGARPEPILVVAGHDNHPARFRKLARRNGVDHHIRWLGPVREIREAFAASDVFVFPSLYDVFGNVGLEALASGVPALLSSRAGVAEVLDGTPGGLVLDDPHDSAELARKTILFLDQASHERRRRAARRLAEGYSWDQHFEKILNVYRDVVAEKRAGIRADGKVTAPMIEAHASHP